MTYCQINHRYKVHHHICKQVSISISSSIEYLLMAPIEIINLFRLKKIVTHILIIQKANPCPWLFVIFIKNSFYLNRTVQIDYSCSAPTLFTLYVVHTLPFFFSCFSIIDSRGMTDDLFSKIHIKINA